MKLRYQTGIASFIQFVVGAGLSFVNQFYSSVSGCIRGSQCITNTIGSIVIVIITAAWFGFVAILGYSAQDRRSQKLARILLLAEAAIILVALYDIKAPPNLLGRITSIIDVFLAIWTIVTAIHLMRAKGGRLVAKNKTRKRTRGQRAPLSTKPSK